MVEVYNKSTPCVVSNYIVRTWENFVTTGQVSSINLETLLGALKHPENLYLMPRIIFIVNNLVQDDFVELLRREELVDWGS